MRSTILLLTLPFVTACPETIPTIAGKATVTVIDADGRPVSGMVYSSAESTSLAKVMTDQTGTGSIDVASVGDLTFYGAFTDVTASPTGMELVSFTVFGASPGIAIQVPVLF